MNKTIKIFLFLLFLINLFTFVGCRESGIDQNGDNTNNHRHIKCDQCGLCIDEDCNGLSNEKCPGHIQHGHIGCDKCGLCIDINCTGIANEKCPGHIQHSHIECDQCGLCIDKNCTGQEADKCVGHIQHSHIECDQCGLCIDKNCTGQEADKCVGHIQHSHIECDQCGLCVDINCTGQEADKCVGHIQHSHIVCDQCGLCTDIDCTDTKHCTGHLQHNHIPCDVCGLCVDKLCNGNNNQKCFGHSAIEVSFEEATEISNALLDNTYTEQIYSVKGIVSGLNVTNNRFYLIDNYGYFSIEIHGIYKNGIEYDARDFVGDEVVINGVIGNIDSIPQMKDVEIISNKQCKVETLDTNEEIEIEFWHFMNYYQRDVLNTIINEFSKLYPNITITPVHYSDAQTLKKAFVNGIPVYELPTLIQAYPDDLALYLTGRCIQELDYYVNSTKNLTSNTLDIIGLSEEEQSQYIIGCMEESRSFDAKGTLYSLPLIKSTEVMYYNKTIFDKYGWSVPKTWDEVVEISEAYTHTTEYRDACNIYGTKVAAFAADSETNLFRTLTKQWGGEFTTFDSYGDGVYSFNNDASKDALRFFKSQYDKGYFATAASLGVNYSSDAFKVGQVIMSIGSSAGANYNLSSDGSFKVGVSLYPQKDLNKPQYLQQGSSIALTKNYNAQEELAGWLFMKYLTNYNSTLLFSTKTNYIPIRYDVLTSREYSLSLSGAMIDQYGTILYFPSVQQLASQIAAKQACSYFTNSIFKGYELACDEAKNIVQSILYNYQSIDIAYSNAISNLLSNY